MFIERRYARRIARVLPTAFLLIGLGTVLAQEKKSDAQEFIGWLLEEDRELSGVPFVEVVTAATGKTVVPVNPTNRVDRELLDKISSALDAVLKILNESNHPAHSERRINEVSAHFENTLRTALNAIPGFSCDYPKTAAGQHQRSGYPDLRLVDKTSGRVIYLDPKLFEQGNRNSTLRTFYYEPKRETNKILDDAHHLIAGFEHAGKQDGRWKFLHWELVDLSHFRVRLKAEFQGSNRDLYRPEAILGTSRR